MLIERRYVMTQKEKEEKRYSTIASIEGVFKDIQTQANTLKNPEDAVKMPVVLQKIKDGIADAVRLYDILREIEEEPVTEEVPQRIAYDDYEDENSGSSFFDFQRNLNAFNNFNSF